MLTGASLGCKKAFSSLGRLLDPITQDVCVFYGSHALYDDVNGVVLDEEEGRTAPRPSSWPRRPGHPS